MNSHVDGLYKLG